MPRERSDIAGVWWLRLISLITSAIGVSVSAGVLGASLLSFDKLKMVLLFDCSEIEVLIPLLGVQMSVGVAYNLSMLAAICSAILLSISCLVLGYLGGRNL